MGVPGKVGLVTALDGEALPDKEYVAKHVEGGVDVRMVDQAAAADALVAEGRAHRIAAGPRHHAQTGHALLVEAAVFGQLAGDAQWPNAARGLRLLSGGSRC